MDQSATFTVIQAVAVRALIRATQMGQHAGILRSELELEQQEESARNYRQHHYVNAAVGPEDSAMEN